MTHQIIRSLLTVNCLENNAVAGERIVHFASVNGLLGTMGTPLCCSGGGASGPCGTPHDDLETGSARFCNFDFTMMIS
jgi:hypothetical protein